MYKGGAFLAFYDLVNTQNLAPEQGSYWTQRVTSKAGRELKVALLDTDSWKSNNMNSEEMVVTITA